MVRRSWYITILATHVLKHTHESSLDDVNRWLLLLLLALLLPRLLLTTRLLRGTYAGTGTGVHIRWLRTRISEVA